MALDRLQLETALRNAHAAGDVEAARRIAAELQKMMPQAPARDVDTERAQVAEGMTLRPFGIDTEIPLNQFFSEFLAGSGRRFADIFSLGTHERSPEADRLLNESGAATAGGIATDVGVMAAGGAAAKATQIPALVAAGKAIQAPTRLGEAALAGGAYNAATSPDRLSAGVLGALGGAGGLAVGKALGSALAPNPSPEVRELMRNNIKLTIGERFGGLVQRLEDGAQSSFVVGDMIKRAKQVSLEDFNRAILDEVLSPLGVKLGDNVHIGDEAYGAIDDLIGSAYDRVIPQTASKLDLNFLKNLEDIKKGLKGVAPEKTLEQFNELVNVHVMPFFKTQDGVATGQTIKNIDSLLGKINRDIYMNRNSTYETRYFADAVSSTRSALRKMVGRQNKEQSSILRRIDSAYARLHPITKTMTNPNVAVRGGVFTPKELLASIKSSTPQRKFARRGGLLQKTSQAGARALSPTVGDSGTAYRALVTSAIVAPGVLMNAAPGGLAMGAAGLAAYTQPGQWLLRNLATSRTGGMLAAGNLATEVSPYAGMLAAASVPNNPQ